MSEMSFGPQHRVDPDVLPLLFPIQEIVWLAYLVESTMRMVNSHKTGSQLAAKSGEGRTHQIRNEMEVTEPKRLSEHNFQLEKQQYSEPDGIFWLEVLADSCCLTFLSEKKSLLAKFVILHLIFKKNNNKQEKVF